MREGGLRIFGAALAALLIFGCQSERATDGSRGDPAGRPDITAPDRPAVSAQEKSQPPEPVPPAPPLVETFDARPQLSLFPRIGDFRPEESDEVRLPFWRTYLEHLLKTSGVVAVDTNGDRAYAFRSIRGIDSVGFFAPLEVMPATTYRVSFRIKTDLPEGGSAGLGIIEYDEFLWVGEQYPESLDSIHRSGEHPGVRVTGRQEWTEQTFTFTTGFNTRMVHLVLFREGTPDRNQVLVDDVAIRRSDWDRP